MLQLKMAQYIDVLFLIQNNISTLITVIQAQLIKFVALLSGQCKNARFS